MDAFVVTRTNAFLDVNESCTFHPLRYRRFTVLLKNAQAIDTIINLLLRTGNLYGAINRQSPQFSGSWT